jgi:hypothetical protein
MILNHSDLVNGGNVHKWHASLFIRDARPTSIVIVSCSSSTLEHFLRDDELLLAAPFLLFITTVNIVRGETRLTVDRVFTHFFKFVGRTFWGEGC